ncbi:hypothetical protein E1171_02715 [Cytophagales bacterium RKSG123]|nr:hypothetical protein [Xanthovirga aplysinae]
MVPTTTAIISMIVGFIKINNFICSGENLFIKIASTSGGRGISIVRIDTTPIIPRAANITPKINFLLFIFFVLLVANGPGGCYAFLASAFLCAGKA